MLAICCVPHSQCNHILHSSRLPPYTVVQMLKVTSKHSVLYSVHIHKSDHARQMWMDTLSEASSGVTVTAVSRACSVGRSRKDRAQQWQPFKSSGEVWIVCSLMAIITHCAVVMCSTLTVWELTVAHLCLMRYSYRLRALIKHFSTITSSS